MSEVPKVSSARASSPSQRRTSSATAAKKFVEKVAQVDKTDTEGKAKKGQTEAIKKKKGLEETAPLIDGLSLPQTLLTTPPERDSALDRSAQNSVYLGQARASNQPSTPAIRQNRESSGNGMSASNASDPSTPSSNSPDQTDEERAPVSQNNKPESEDEKALRKALQSLNNTIKEEKKVVANSKKALVTELEKLEKKEKVAVAKKNPTAKALDSEQIQIQEVPPQTTAATFSTVATPSASPVTRFNAATTALFEKLVTAITVIKDLGATKTVITLGGNKDDPFFGAKIEVLSSVKGEYTITLYNVSAEGMRLLNQQAAIPNLSATSTAAQNTLQMKELTVQQALMRSLNLSNNYQVHNFYVTHEDAPNYGKRGEEDERQGQQRRQKEKEKNK